MQKDKIFKTILLFCIPLLVLSCSKTAGDDSPGQDANLALALITRSENGDLAITGEDRFTSLAVYIFNNDNGDLEFSELITDFTPESSASLYTKSVRVTQDKKAVYAIANYAGQSFTAGGADTPVGTRRTASRFRDFRGQRYRHGRKKGSGDDQYRSECVDRNGTAGRPAGFARL